MIEDENTDEQERMKSTRKHDYVGKYKKTLTT